MPGRLTVRFEKVAMPFTGKARIVPPSVAPVGLVISVIVTESAKFVIVLPNASRTTAVTGGEIG